MSFSATWESPTDSCLSLLICWQYTEDWLTLIAERHPSESQSETFMGHTLAYSPRSDIVLSPKELWIEIISLLPISTSALAHTELSTMRRESTIVNTTFNRYDRQGLAHRSITP